MESIRASGGVSEVGGQGKIGCAAFGALELDDHAVGVVADEAGKLLFGCKPVNERAKSDTLDYTTDPDAFSPERCGSDQD